MTRSLLLVALLALLSTTRRLYRGRDQLVTVLWPDADAERGTVTLIVQEVGKSTAEMVNEYVHAPNWSRIFPPSTGPPTPATPKAVKRDP